MALVLVEITGDYDALKYMCVQNDAGYPFIHIACWLWVHSLTRARLHDELMHSCLIVEHCYRHEFCWLAYGHMGSSKEHGISSSIQAVQPLNCDSLIENAHRIAFFQVSYLEFIFLH